MTTTVEQGRAGVEVVATPPAWRRLLALVLAAAAAGLAAWSAAVWLQAGAPAHGIARGIVALAWGAAGAFLGVRRSGEPMGVLAGLVGTVAGIASASSAIARLEPGEEFSRPMYDLAEAIRPFAIGALAAAGLHMLLTVPDGVLGATTRRIVAAIGYATGIGAGAMMWAAGPDARAWPVAVAASLFAPVGFGMSNARYRRARGSERQRTQWFGWAVTASLTVIGVAVTLRLLLGWPRPIGDIAAVTTALMPFALVLGSTRAAERVDRLLAHSISVAGLGGVVIAVYLAIVLGLGRVPSERERTLLLLSMLAAGVAALVYLPTRARLQRVANRLVYGERRAPDEVLRTFGTRLSRSIPLDELLLQVAESLRKTLALVAAEVWTGSSGVLERSVSDPDRPKAKFVLAEAEQSVVARAGVSGSAWVAIWLPALQAGREGSMLRVAPITHSGELLGLIVAERAADDENFTAEHDRVLAELARQVGLVLHNVRLDSALQASLDEVRRQAEELRASRARIVAAGDAERRKIERNIHDGAQQRLVALKVKLRLVNQLSDMDPAAAKAMLDELSEDVQETLQELRDLAHGIYPPLLMDRGLPEALAAAAGRSPLPTEVRAGGIGRYSPDVEATVYFCCLEALQNAGKHAGEGAVAAIRIWEEAGGLFFEVSDDGAGFDAAKRRQGAGFVNMSDRLGAIGGTLRVESAPGQGTKVAARIPLPR